MSLTCLLCLGCLLLNWYVEAFWFAPPSTPGQQSNLDSPGRCSVREPTTLRPLSQGEVQHYKEDGVVFIPSILTSEWIDMLTTAVDRVVARPSLLGVWLGSDKKELAHEAFLWQRDDAFKDFSWFSGIAPIASQLLYERSNATKLTNELNVTRLFYDQLFVKLPGGNVKTPYHHDRTFWPIRDDIDMENATSARLDSNNNSNSSSSISTNNNTMLAVCEILTLWFPLDHVTSMNGKLNFIKGSHKWRRRFQAISVGEIPGLINESLSKLPTNLEQQFADDLLSFDMAPGDALAFSFSTVHGGGKNAHPTSSRRALAVRFANDQCRYAPSQHTMVIPFDHGLEPGEKLRGEIFPQILPRMLAHECEGREQIPFLPSLSIITQAGWKDVTYHVHHAIQNLKYHMHRLVSTAIS